jgi:hypothetical protein
MASKDLVIVRLRSPPQKSFCFSSVWTAQCCFEVFREKGQLRGDAESGEMPRRIRIGW